MQISIKRLIDNRVSEIPICRFSYAQISHFKLINRQYTKPISGSLQSESPWCDSINRHINK